MTTHATTGDGFTWTAHPARERPWRAALGIALILSFVAALWLEFASPWWAAFALVVLLASLNRFFLPSRFAIDAKRITARYPMRTQQMNWIDVRRFMHDANGGYLSTRARASRMDGFRGMHLLLGHEPEQVIAIIDSHLATARQSESSGSSQPAQADRTSLPARGAAA
jgi:hypothetical protein